MSNSSNFGASFAFDVTDLKAGLAQANRLIRESESEFRAAAAGMDDWSQSEEGLVKRQESLNYQITIQKQKIDALNKEKKDLIKTMTEEGATHEEIEKAIDQTNKQIVKESKELDKLQRAADKSEQNLEEFRNTTDEVGQETSETADEVEDLDSALEDLQGISAGVVKGIAAIGAAAAAAVGAFLSLAESTREYRDNISKLESAFETAGHTTEEATQVYKELYSVFGEEDRAVEAAQQIAALAKNEQDMAQMTEIATGAWAKWGDSLATESLMEAVNSTSKIGEVQGTLADALEWSGVNLDGFNEKLGEMNTEEERSAFILDTLTGLYSESAENYKKNSKSIIEARKAQSDYNDTLAELGEKAEPITTKVTQGFTRILESVNDLLDDDAMGGIDKALDKAFDVFIDDVIPAVVKGIELIIEHGDTLIGILKAVALGFAAFKITSIVTSAVNGFKSLVTAITSATTAQQGLNAAQAANVIGAVVTAVVLLVEGLIALSKATDDAINGWSKMNSAIDDNVEANGRWLESMEAAQATLGDYSSMVSASGQTTGDLETKMREAQDGITQIFRDAFSENRGLREEEIKSIKQFNQDYIAAQQELAELQGLILKAQTDSLQWQLDNLDLSEEEINGILNTLEVKRGEYISFMDQSIAEEIALYDMQYQQGVISEQEWSTLREGALAKQGEYRAESSRIQQEATQDGLNLLQETINMDALMAIEREKAFASMEEIQTYYAQKIDEINADETLSWYEKTTAINGLQNQMIQDMGAFNQGQQVNYDDYSFMTDTMISQNVQAYFNWIGEVKAAGGTLTQENVTLARNIIASYDNLPEELQEAGLASLQGLAAGMADEYPELENYADMSMDELVSVMDGVLAKEGPGAGSTLIKGVESGMNSEKPQLESTASTIASGIAGIFSKAIEGIKGFINSISAEINGTATMASASANSTRVASAAAAYKSANSTGSGNSKRDSGSGNKNITINQTNTYSSPIGRTQLWKNLQDTESALKLALKTS